MLPEPRPYQSRAIEQIRAARRSGARRILAVSPTGSGKSVLATLMSHRAFAEFDQRILVIVHSGELVGQWYHHLTGAGLPCGVMQADDYRTNVEAPVQIGTNATLLNRDLPPADLIFCDEANMAVADTFSRILAAYPRATIIGLTATPCRLDGSGLDAEFDVMVEVAKYSELIDAGAIYAPIVYGPSRNVDLSGVSIRTGDYAQDQLEAVMVAPHVVGDVYETWRKHAGGRRTVLFAVGIEHSRELVDRFTAEGVRARHIDGSTPRLERMAVLSDLASGQLDVVSNVAVLTYGWDCPSVKCCIDAAPTQSLAKYMQRVGRVLRPHGDKAPLVLDHAGNVSRHGLPHEDRVWSLDGKAKRASQITYRTCAKCFAYFVSAPACPLCGYVAPAAPPREIKQVAGTLEQILAKPVSTDPKRMAYDKSVDEARRKGFKPGYAAAKYKEANGDKWPSWSWSTATKAEYQKDPEWQARVAKREREREFWQQRQKQQEAVEVANVEEEPFPY